MADAYHISGLVVGEVGLQVGVDAALVLREVVLCAVPALGTAAFPCHIGLLDVAAAVLVVRSCLL
jgi:hypothetical protein